MVGFSSQLGLGRASFRELSREEVERSSGGGGGDEGWSTSGGLGFQR